MDHVSTNSVELYRYLEQDERVLAAIAKSDEARSAHLLIANQYHELALRTSVAGAGSPQSPLELFPFVARYQS